MKATTIIHDFVALLFPRLCPICEDSLRAHEATVCTTCLMGLPFARMTGKQENSVEKVLKGRIPINGGTALLYFKAGNPTQKLMHAFKYDGQREVAVWLGTLLGDELIALDFDSENTVIVPVPLHKRKLSKRGFNQAELIGAGVAEAMGLVQLPHGLIRTRFNKTQTRKTRFDRWRNTEGLFVVDPAVYWEGKQVILIDDVITSGSTLEAAATPLLEAGANVYVALLAYAEL